VLAAAAAIAAAAATHGQIQQLAEEQLKRKKMKHELLKKEQQAKQLQQEQAETSKREYLAKQQEQQQQQQQQLKKRPLSATTTDSAPSSSSSSSTSSSSSCLTDGAPLNGGIGSTIAEEETKKRFKSSQSEEAKEALALVELMGRRVYSRDSDEKHEGSSSSFSRSSNGTDGDGVVYGMRVKAASDNGGSGVQLTSSSSSSEHASSSSAPPLSARHVTFLVRYTSTSLTTKEGHGPTEIREELTRTELERRLVPAGTYGDLAVPFLLSASAS
jgi:hypothetical protein